MSYSNQKKPGMAKPIEDSVMDRDIYESARDNPPPILRPGAEDHKNCQSLVCGVAAVYRDRGHV